MVVLKHMEELDYQEISQILGASVSALKVRAHRARELLRGILEKAGTSRSDYAIEHDAGLVADLRLYARALAPS